MILADGEHDEGWFLIFANVVGVLHINSDEARIQAVALHPEPAHHLVGLVWFAGADDIQRLLAVELNPVRVLVCTRLSPGT